MTTTTFNVHTIAHRLAHEAHETFAATASAVAALIAETAEAIEGAFLSPVREALGRSSLSAPRGLNSHLQRDIGVRR